MSQQLDEQLHAAQKEDWERIRELELHLQQGQPLELTALQVAFSPEDAERGLRSPEEAAALVTRIRRRMREGSERSARQVVLDALAEEVVPYYRGLLEALLQSVATLRK